MKKSFSSRLIACVVVALMLVSAFSVSVFADNTASMLTALANDDKVAIFYPDASKALGNTLSGNKIAAVDATVSDGKLTVTADMGIFTVKTDETKNAFYLVDTNGKYLTSGATGNSMSLADEASDLALWSLEEAENGFYVKNYAAAYVSGETTKPQYLEYYNGFTTYSFNSSKKNIYTFAFYKVENAPVAPPADNPSDDPSDEPEELVFSTVSEARLGENNAIFNVKGVVTFIDGKNVVIADETGAINLYLKKAAEVSVGNKISATGKRAAYSGLQQLTSAEVLEVLEESATLPAVKDVTLEEILLDQEAETLECFFVKLEGVTLGETNAEKKTTVITDDKGNTINIYKCPALEIEAGTKVDVIALVSDFNGYQLRVANASDITVATADEPSDEPSDVPSDEPSVGPAKPGDSSILVFYALVAMISFAALMVVTRKKA